MNNYNDTRCLFMIKCSFIVRCIQLLMVKIERANASAFIRTNRVTNIDATTDACISERCFVLRLTTDKSYEFLSNDRVRFEIKSVRFLDATLCERIHVANAITHVLKQTWPYGVPNEVEKNIGITCGPARDRLIHIFSTRNNGMESMFLGILRISFQTD